MAAVQCLTNLALHENVAKLFEGDNDRVKYLMLLSSEPEDGATEDVDDIETMKAASGTLAIVSTGNRAVCGKILRDAPGAIDILLWLVANPIVDLQIRGVTIVRNILDADKEFAEQLIGTPVFEVLMALSSQPATQDTDPAKQKQNQDLKKRAEEALGVAEKWELIKKN